MLQIALYRYRQTEALEARQRAGLEASDRGLGRSATRDGRRRRRESAESVCRLADELAIHRDLSLSRVKKTLFAYCLLYWRQWTHGSPGAGAMDR
jgi:hypothetical protein